ncbi:MAG TPA: SMC family ATPase [Caldisericia bacterium]|nr:SMC family ATPase [Caldisericia bacterium]HQG60139.1 SMC family ATPase [Caldisericia bacterium]HQH48449.1 SMC family ATPase [Caldisericia bacterium]HQJ44264.1 SMC family ATPase [Caldisericia bacterium]
MRRPTGQGYRKRQNGSCRKQGWCNLVPISLEITDFLSYRGFHQLDFSSFHVASITGMNGAGKSAILDAITWALFGQARKPTLIRSKTKSDRETVINDDANTCEVSLTFRIGQNTYLVDRAMDRGGAIRLQFRQITRDGENDLRGKSTPETDQAIETELGFTYEVFASSSFITQGDSARFMEAKPKERREILAQILQLDKYGACKEIADSRLKSLKEETSAQKALLEDKSKISERIPQIESDLAQAEYDLNSAERQWEECRKNLESLRKNLSVAEAKRKTLEETKTKTTKLEKELGEIASSIAELDKRISQYKKLLENETQVNLGFEKLGQKRQELERLTEKEVRVSALEKTRTQAQAKIDIKAKELETKLVQLSSQIDESLKAQTMLEGLQKEADRLGEEKAKIAKTREEKHSWDLSLQQAKNTLAGAEKKFAEQQGRLEKALKLTGLEDASKIDSTLGKIHELQAGIPALEEEITSIKKSVSDAEGEKATAIAEIDHLEKEIQVLGEGKAGKCPLCGQELPSGGSAKLVEEKRAKIGECKISLQDINEKIDPIKQSLASAEKKLDLAKQSVGKIPLLEQAMSISSESGQISQELEEKRKSFEEARKGFLLFEETNGLVLQQENQTLAQYEQASKQLTLTAEKASKIENLKEHEASLQKEFISKSFATEELELIEKTKKEIEAEEFDQMELSQAKKAVSELEPFAQQKTELEVAKANLAGATEQSETAKKRFSSINGDIVESQRLLLELGDAEREYQEAVQKTGAEEQREKLLQKQRDQAFSGRNMFAKSLEDAKKALEESSQIQEKLVTLEKDQKVFERIKEMFGIDGIPSRVLQGVAPQLEEIANSVLQRISQGHTGSESLRMEIKLERESKDKSLSTLDVILTDGQIARPYELFSGGERFRADFAIRLALSKLLAQRAGAKLQTLVVDEGFGTQDSEGIKRLVEAINEMSSDFEKILVVSHVEEMRNSFERKILVTRDDDGSHFEIV